MTQRQYDADLEDYRGAPGGEGPHAANWADKPHRLVYDLCEMVQALRAELAGAEERARAAERAAVLDWLCGVGDQYMDGDAVPCDEFTGEAYHQAATEIKLGRHARTGTTPPDAGESQG
jgi:hypothetical protein